MAAVDDLLEKLRKDIKGNLVHTENDTLVPPIRPFRSTTRFSPGLHYLVLCHVRLLGCSIRLQYCYYDGILGQE